MARNKFGDSVEILGVAWAGDEASYAEFIARHGLTFANIDDTAGAIYSRYSVPYQPAWVFIQRDGTSRTMRGSLDDASLADALADLAST